MYYAEAEMQRLKHMQLFANILNTKAYIQAARNVDRWMLVYCYCYALPENKNTSEKFWAVSKLLLAQCLYRLLMLLEETLAIWTLCGGILLYICLVAVNVA